MNLAQMITITKLMSVHEIVSIEPDPGAALPGLWLLVTTSKGVVFTIYPDGFANRHIKAIAARSV